MKYILITLVVVVFAGLIYWGLRDRAPQRDPVAIGQEEQNGEQEQGNQLNPNEAQPEQNLQNGLKIQDLRVGTGQEAKAGDVITVHYVGTLEDGSKFDSSRDRGAPFSFSLGAGRVIEGWDIGVEGMRVGGVRKLTIPASLGYGELGNPPVIPPNAILIFEVELLQVNN